MKRLLPFFFFVVLLCLATNVGAQDTDSFDNNESMIGKKIRLYDAVALYQKYGAFSYAKVFDKYVRIRDISVYREIESSLIEIKGIVSDKKKQFLQVKYQDSDSSFYWKLNDSFEYYSHACNIDYWDQRFEQLKMDYAYIIYPSTIIFSNIDTTTTVGRYKRLKARQEITSKLLLDHYLPISWISYKLPQTRHEAVSFMCQYGGLSRTFSLIELAQNKDSFASNNEFAAAEEEQRHQEEAKRLRDSIADGEIICEAIVLSSLTVKDKIFEEYNNQDTLFISIFEASHVGNRTTGATHYRGYVLEQEINLPKRALRFINDSARVFIESRGAMGSERRRQVAQQNDSIRSREYREVIAKREAIELERERKAQKQLAEIYKFRKQKKIVILSCTTVRSSPTKGLKVKVYNPFEKAIKYYYIKTVAINAVNDPESDDLGRIEKEAKCIGFVEKGEERTFEFEDMYWDKNDILHRIIISSIRLVFSDNTSITYSGIDANFA